MNDSQFYGYVAALLQESGHMVASVPVYSNHSSQEALYFDSGKDVTVSRFERNLLAAIENVSLLVELEWPGIVDDLLETVHIYSITVNFPERTRSENVADIHRLLCEFWTCQHSVVFFKNKEDYIISFANTEVSHILSDWFSLNADNNDLVDRIHIANISLNSSFDYFSDLIYAVARRYYVYPISFEEASLCMIPSNFLMPCVDALKSITKDEIETMILNNMRHFENVYGDDYVEAIYEGLTGLHRYHNLSDEIERISFELELSTNIEADEDDEMFDFGMDYESEDDIDDTFDDDIDPAIFDDPVLMVKWLQKRQRQLDDAEFSDHDPTNEDIPHF